jgi:hypothetical protein
MSLLDLEVISEFGGRTFLPYPFMFTRASPYATQDEALAYTITVPDRFLHGDLHHLAECTTAYLDSDIRVECHVQHIPSETPSVRTIAWRTRQLGFFAAQRPDEDVVDAYAVSPYDLGAAIAEVVPLEEPGRHAAIVVPEFVSRRGGRFAAEAFSVNDRSTSSSELKIAAGEVTVYSTVQSHWRPTRKWGFDRSKAALVWIRVKDDGDYIYTPDGSHARPVTRGMLQDRIDRLIADDIAILREFRRD